MTRDEWQEVIYAALGIPEAVTDKAGIARELLDRFSSSLAATQDLRRQDRRTGARDAVLTDLAGCLEAGELDRLLVNLEDIGRVAARVAELIGQGHAADEVYERKAILDHLLPRLLATATTRARKPPLTLPFALRRPPP